MKEDRLDVLMQSYLRIPKDSTDINGMIHLREQIAGELYHLGAEVGEARKQFMVTKALYEGKKLMLRMDHLEEGIGRAETISRANTSEELLMTNEADGNYHILKYQYESAREALSALNQKISYLKEEAKYTRAIS